MRHGLLRQAVRVSGFRGALGILAAASGALLGPSPAPAAPADAAPAAPIVAGYERLKSEAKPDETALGEILLGELNCLQCHTAEGQKHVLTKGAPDLSEVGARVTPQFLKAYLSDPHAAKPGATMPDLLHATDAAAKQTDVEALTDYLASLGGPIAQAKVEGNVMLVEQGRLALPQRRLRRLPRPGSRIRPDLGQGGVGEPGAEPAEPAEPAARHGPTRRQPRRQSHRRQVRRRARRAAGQPRFQDDGRSTRGLPAQPAQGPPAQPDALVQPEQR